MRDIILRNKRGSQQEYTIHLFEFCNLNCQFCWQDHDNKIGLDDISSVLSPIEEFLDSEVKKSVVFNVMGGEIFAPAIYTSELNEVYKKFSLALHTLCTDRGITGLISWVSNLVTDKNHLIEDLLNYSIDNGISAEITSSYDPRGRFNKKEFKVFKQNVDYWGDRVTGFSCILTKSNIEHYMYRGDKYFDYLYSNGKTINFDYLMPTEVNMPTNKLLLDFFKFCIDKYPKTEPIQGWINRDNNELSCRTTKVVLAKGIGATGEVVSCNCGNMEEHPENYSSVIEAKSNKHIENSFLKKYDCISCEFFSRCTMGCFMHHDYIKEDDLDECLYKLTHRYIQNKNRIPLDLVV
jgi:sulfatase maturation enzyme AslB (radical SAM superfamily)